MTGPRPQPPVPPRLLLALGTVAREAVVAQARSPPLHACRLVVVDVADEELLAGGDAARRNERRLDAEHAIKKGGENTFKACSNGKVLFKVEKEEYRKGI